MTTPRTTPQLGHIDDHELGRLAAEWRKSALRGDRESYGIAHALEVEQRRRLRPSQMAELPSAQPVQRSWWRFWSVGSDNASSSIARIRSSTLKSRTVPVRKFRGGG